MVMFEVVSCRMGARQFDDVHASYPGSGRAALALYLTTAARSRTSPLMSELGLGCVAGEPLLGMRDSAP